MLWIHHFGKNLLVLTLELVFLVYLIAVVLIYANVWALGTVFGISIVILEDDNL